MPPQPMGIAIIVKPDGTVPFEKDVLPQHKAAMIAHLRATGHAFEEDSDGSPTVKHHENGSHAMRLKAGPIMEQHAANAAAAKAAGKPWPPPPEPAAEEPDDKTLS